MKNPKVEYWTMFNYGDSQTICSTHRTLLAAKRAAKTCENRGGAKHWIIEVRGVEEDVKTQNPRLKKSK